MMLNRSNAIFKIHLIISILIVVPVAILYGFSPDYNFELFPQTNDEHNFYKAIMGLYLGFSIVWILGIINTKYLKIALITNVVFMLGLGIGRLVSIAVDGIPTDGYVFGTIAELGLAIYGLWALKNHSKAIQ